eukprot:symbB.v1.2.038864.t1/scaffold6213.1/size20058/2
MATLDFTHVKTITFVVNDHDVRVMAVYPGEIMVLSSIGGTYPGHVDLTDDMDSLRVVLDKMPVKDLTLVLNRLELGGIPRNPKKYALVNAFVDNIDTIKEQALKMSRLLMQEQVAQTPAPALVPVQVTSGVASQAKGSDGSDDDFTDKEKAFLWRLFDASKRQSQPDLRKVMNEVQDLNECSIKVRRVLISIQNDLMDKRDMERMLELFAPFAGVSIAGKTPIDDLTLNTLSSDEKSLGVVKVDITSDTLGETKCYVFNYTAEHKWQDIYDALAVKGYDVSDSGALMLKGKDSASRAVSYESITSWGSQDIHLVVIGGEAGGVKNFGIKKDDSIKKLIGASQNNLAKRLGKRGEPSGLPPLEVQNYIQSVLNKVSALEAKFDANEITFESLLQSLEDSKLKQIVEVMSVKTGYTEDRLVVITEIVMDDLKNADNGVIALKNMKLDVIHFFLKKYAETYGIQRGNSAQYGNDAFLQEIKQILSFRAGMRRMMTSDASESAVPSTNLSCATM